MKKMMDIESSCRTCMKNNTNLVNLSQAIQIDEDNIQLSTLLQEFVTNQVSLDDKLPHQICEDCIKVLQILYSFRNQVTKAELEFKRLLQNEDLKTEIKAEDTNDLGDYYDEFDNTNFVKDEIDKKINYFCEKCFKTFTKEKKYFKHLLTHNSEFVCLVCNKPFYKQSLLQHHINSEHGTDNSDLANTITPIEIKLEDIDTQTNTCSICSKVFQTSKSLNSHMKRHISKLPGKCICDTCGKEFYNKSQLRRHLKLHLQRSHQCDQCDKKYTRADQLNDHKRRHFNDKPNACPHCNKAFTQVSNLKDHIRTHTGETPFLCSECGKGFSNRSNLRQHMFRHTGVKPFTCSLCPKEFSTKGQMSAHVLTHTGIHPYKCDKCGASFTKSNSLKKHMLIHTGERPYGCDTCAMRFTCKDHLNRHNRIHTGEKPYKCKMCDKAFSQSNDLAKHLRTHLGQNIYDCKICCRKFRLKSELKQHYPIHFNGDAKPEGNDKTQQLEDNKQMDNRIELPQTKDNNNMDPAYMITINSGTDHGIFTINILDANEANL